MIISRSVASDERLIIVETFSRVSTGRKTDRVRKIASPDL